VSSPARLGSRTAPRAGAWARAKRRLCQASLVATVAAGAFAAAGCKGCEDSDEEEEEERERLRELYWRARIEIVGEGQVKTVVPGFDCVRDGAGQRWTCGPLLLKFKELQPPLMRATAADGWAFDHWESLIRGPAGKTRMRTDPMPDGPLYLNSFRYEDTGETETVRCVFSHPDGGAPGTPR
jgi:hypothetical protein